MRYYSRRRSGTQESDATGGVGRGQGTGGLMPVTEPAKTSSQIKGGKGGE